MEAAMVKTVQQLWKLVLLTLLGWGGSIIIGLMVYGSEVFKTTSVGFSFVSFGLSGAFIFAFYNVRGLSETITAAVIASTLQFIVSAQWIGFLSGAIWSYGVNLPLILVAFLFERKLEPFKLYKFVVVALLYGGMFVMLTLLVAWLTGGGALPGQVFRQNFLDGLLIGLGLAIGIEGGEAIIHSLEHHSIGPKEKHA
jgi:hypothetical protein